MVFGGFCSQVVLTSWDEPLNCHKNFGHSPRTSKHFPEPRFWIASGLPRVRGYPLMDTSAFPSTYSVFPAESILNECFGLFSPVESTRRIVSEKPTSRGRSTREPTRPNALFYACAPSVLAQMRP